MSYEIAKGIRVDKKNNKIFLRSSSNNIYPKYYSSWEFMKSEPDLEKKKRELFYGIIGGSINLRICDNKNWKYGAYRFFDYCDENNISTSYIWELPRNGGSMDSIEEYYKIFEGFVNEKYKGLYYLNSNVGRIINVNNRGFTYTNSDIRLDKYSYDYKTAYLKRAKLSRETIEKYEIEIQKYEKVREVKAEGDLLYS